MGMWAEHRDRAAQHGFIQVMALLGASFITLEVIVYSAVGGRAGLGHSGVVLLLVVAQLALQACVIAARPVEPGFGPSRGALLALVAQLAVVLLATELFHEACGILAGSLSGSLPLILRARYAWPLFCLVIALVSMLCTRDAESLSQALPHLLLMAGAIVVVGLMSYTLTQAVLLIHRTRCSRNSIAKAVAESEQNRLARDLHDLLGHTFSAVAMRAELVNRSFKVSPERAATEAEELVRTSRQAMAEFRMAVRGYQGVSLAAEVPTAASLLRAMNIGVTLRIDALPEGEDVSLALAAVLRESVTNVLRHSKASHCTIALTRGLKGVRLEVSNDGAAASASRLCGTAPGNGGAGLGNLGQRVSALGGSFHTEIRPGGVFRVVAEIPARAVAAPHGSDDGTPVVHAPAIRGSDIRRWAARIAVPAAAGK
ncbi:sensor histidine kinase [Streptomyces sp. NPDC057271]|uniref:sensor histidine kinase n=1 Tax=unclassified Streptomyces TaxID=2593676 RepID=UPI003634B6A5